MQRRMRYLTQRKSSTTTRALRIRTNVDTCQPLPYSRNDIADIVLQHGEAEVKQHRRDWCTGETCDHFRI